MGGAPPSRRGPPGAVRGVSDISTRVRWMSPFRFFRSTQSIPRVQAVVGMDDSGQATSQVVFAL